MKAVDKLPPLLALSGPTASGKSALAVAICEALARPAHIWEGAEIVSVDSAQVYRGMDIGTAKPSAALRAQIPHHLIDIADPAQAYSAARFAADARKAVAEIRARNRVPLLVGGTLLYFRALFEGLNELPSADPALRAKFAAEAAIHGWPAMHARLAQADPATAQRLHPNDAQRIQRALEIVHLLGGEMPRTSRNDMAASTIDGRMIRIAIVPPDRARLRERIDARFQQMLDAGLIDEVGRLRLRGDLHPDLPSIRAVGYRQLWAHLDGEYDLDEAAKRAMSATRQYAKRQFTWLRAEAESWNCIPELEPNTVQQVLNLLTR